ncbi:hypothetical protein [Paenirhodobacter populi]|uniref:hypothetical protein n=1 Tax=Paenirhodobacter populi TaxID=2306993 RepID=UPI000FE2A6B1|nr:hypothetical protein [Sinirhodobacter populi]RWR03996.1 hypothetical protein D2T32_21105 [Sinirhodobacter populi]
MKDKNDGFWAHLAAMGPKMRYVADEVWKISQWLVASTALLLIAQRSQNHLALWTGIIVLCFAALLFAFSAASFIYGGVTEKAKAMGRWPSVLLATGILMICLYFGVLVATTWTTVGLLLASPNPIQG